MDQHDLKAIVENIASWQGNTYRLAVMVAEAQKEVDAVKAEDAGSPEVAAVIRAGD